ncbi:MAG: response regulator transcription factor [Psychrosphaera sp.]|nr:response regulator transcription factor [Psychrosphaera sp.]
MTDQSKPHILIVEDDLEICRLLKMFLNSKGYRVSLSHNGEKGLADIRQMQPDLVVLDIMMPGKNGIEVCQQCRTDFAGPILILTACSEDISEVTALGIGADGYLHKPLRPHILLAHIEAQLRGAQLRQTQGTQTTVLCHGLSIDLQNRTVSRDNQPIELTGSEFELLEYLAKRPGTVVSRDDCYRALKGIEFDGLDRALDMRLSGLRKKIGDDQPPYRMIKTVRGKGYLFVNQTDE